MGGVRFFVIVEFFLFSFTELTLRFFLFLFSLTIVPISLFTHLSILIYLNSFLFIPSPPAMSSTRSIYCHMSSRFFCLIIRCFKGYCYVYIQCRGTDYGSCQLFIDNLMLTLIAIILNASAASNLTASIYVNTIGAP